MYLTGFLYMELCLTLWSQLFLYQDKRRRTNSKDNYRLTTLASVLSKIFENILLSRLELYLKINEYQYGFKRKLGTDMCICALMEIIQKYHSLNSIMLLCFLDASNAVDRVNHAKLFEKLVQHGTRIYLIRILIKHFISIGLPLEIFT